MSWKNVMVRAMVAMVVPMGLVVAETNTPCATNKAEQGGQRMVKALGLSADQATKYQQMLKEHQAAIKAENERFQTQVNGILTPDQQAKFKELTEKRAEQPKKEQADAPRGGLGGGLSQLNLSAEQESQVKAIMQEARTKMATVAPGDRAARKQLRQDMQAQLAKILTPEQMNQLKQMRPGHGPFGKRGR